MAPGSADFEVEVSPTRSQKRQASAAAPSMASKVDWSETALNFNLKNAVLLTECAEIETRLRQHVLELVDPTIKRQHQLDVKFKDLKAQMSDIVAEIARQKRSSEGQESLRGVVQGFRVELAEWDRERREHEQQVGDRCSLQDIEINELRRAIDKKTSDLAASGRVLKSLGDNVADVREEILNAQKFCTNGLELGRDKLFKLRDEFETRQLALESDVYKQRDGQTECELAVHALETQLGLVRRDVDEALEVSVALKDGKASVHCLEEQQQEFSEFARRIDAHVSGLGQRFSNLVDDVKDHFRTANQVGAASTSQLMNEMRDKYREEVKRVGKVMDEWGNFYDNAVALETELKSSVEKASSETAKQVEAVTSDVAKQLRKREIESKEMAMEIKRLQRITRQGKGGTTQQTAESGGTQHGGAQQAEGRGSMALAGLFGDALVKDVLKMLIESSLLSAALDLQDDQDRKDIALFGMKPGTSAPSTPQGLGKTQLPELEGARHTMGSSGSSAFKFKASSGAASSRGTPRTPRGGGGFREAQAGPVVSLDKRCLACSGSQATVLAGFKLACLHYAPQPVDYQQVQYSRSELIRLRIDLLEQVKAQLSAAE